MQDEPGGTGLCADNTDVADCAICSWTNDGWCDEPGGTGLCSAGTDSADCDTCLWRDDGDCDEITGLCPAGSDTNDCQSYRSSCFWTNDGECDEHTGLCPVGSDTNDCQSSSGTCPWTNDGECVSDNSPIFHRSKGNAHKSGRRTSRAAGTASPAAAPAQQASRTRHRGRAAPGAPPASTTGPTGLPVPAVQAGRPPRSALTARPTASPAFRPSAPARAATTRTGTTARIAQSGNTSPSVVTRRRAALSALSKQHDNRWCLGCILPRVPAIIVRTGERRASGSGRAAQSAQPGGTAAPTAENAMHAPPARPHQNAPKRETTAVRMMRIFSCGFFLTQNVATFRCTNLLQWRVSGWVVLPGLRCGTLSRRFRAQFHELHRLSRGEGRHILADGLQCVRCRKVLQRGPHVVH